MFLQTEGLMKASNKPKHVAYSIYTWCCAWMYIRKYMYFINGPTEVNHLKITRNDVSCKPAASILRVLCVFTLAFSPENSWSFHSSVRFEHLPKPFQLIRQRMISWVRVRQDFWKCDRGLFDDTEPELCSDSVRVNTGIPVEFRNKITKYKAWKLLP